ncbi:MULTISPECIES: chalcone isomerase family protein [Pseudomonas]|uniref:chalcone isomerase family protein n=1 Tax=Pseudomonas TaxID=286 RepID=UPI001BE5AA5D|nr:MULTISPECIES: chalcone isomerase family protein [Pseudomonas]MBT2341197.1 chalcone isomerase family protein [Pseudomonas fluorescens]MCD4531286.1 chalcone isomerase family protein [Pseudomonas sp. C3-2018]
MASRTLVLGITLAILMTTTTSAWPDWRPALPAARLAGSGEFTWIGLRLYTARLWQVGATWHWQEPFALELIYHRALSRDALVQASVDEMRRLADKPLAEERLERWTQAMREAFVDVRPGMRITGLYLPGQGCRFYVDGQLSLEVADPAFARAFFAIWLDPRARDQQLRQRLLGQVGNERGD